MIPAVALVMVATNEHHRLIWSTWTVDPLLVPVLVVGHGPMFWVVNAYSHVLLAAGAFLLLSDRANMPRVSRVQGAAMVAAIAAPWAGNLFYVSGLSPLGPLDLTPFGFVVMGLAGTWIIARARLLELVPIARNTVVETIDAGMICSTPPSASWTRTRPPNGCWASRRRPCSGAGRRGWFRAGREEFRYGFEHASAFFCNAH